DLHIVAAPESDSLLVAYALISEPSKGRGLVLRLQSDRALYREGVHAVRLFVWVTLAGSFLAALLLYLIMDRLAWSSRKRKQSEQRYQRLSQEFQTILDAIPSAITLVNRDMSIAWANRAAGLFYGWDNLELSDRKIDQQTHSCLLERESCPVQLCFVSGQADDALIVYPDGKFVSEKAFPLLGPDRKVQQVVCNVTDVTEKVQMRAENEEAGRLAALGELSAGIAHEINNPNGMIRMNLGLLVDVWNDIVPLLSELGVDEEELTLGGVGYRRLKAEVPELLVEMERASDRIKGIVEDLKAFARREENDLDEEVDLIEVVRASERLVANVLRKSGADYRLVAADGLPRVRGSFRQLEQVVINLLVNACQALDGSGRKVEVVIEPLPEGEIMLVVEDQGCGIPQEMLAKITDPFVTTKRSSGGTGLGLSISSRIIREHGGRMQFFSEPGSGTRVEIRLPAATGQIESMKRSRGGI
ncbi:MAG: hypothetical protein D6751_11105, partial [Deltaproteobacteria bacterium]